MSTFVFLNSTLQISLLNNIVNNKKNGYGRNIDHKFISAESIWFTIYYYLNKFLYIFKIFQLTEKYMYVEIT